MIENTWYCKTRSKLQLSWIKLPILTYTPYAKHTYFITLRALTR